MRIMNRLFLTGAALLLALHGGDAFAAPRSVTVTNETLGQIEVVGPAGEPKLFVIAISDKDGLTQARRAEADRLVEKGAAVALIDLPALLAKVSASEDEDCHYTFGDFEDLTRIAQRQLGMTTWRWPVLLGTGEGGTLAYLALAQAPDNTTAGAVSVGFEPHLATRLPLCGGAVHTGTENGVHNYDPTKDLPAAWRWISAAQPAPDLARFAAASPMAQLHVVPGDAGAQFDAAIDAVVEIGSPPAGAVADLPLVELPAKGKPRALAVFISGDGGWRDIDKQIGEYLQAHGVAIVGVDSLRYFWSKKPPEVVAADVDRVVKHYQQLWQVRKTALLGYSFGADILPLAWGRMTPATRDATDLVGLISPEPTADLEVTVSGWLGFSGANEVAVRPYLAEMPANKVMCVYGADEVKDNETACVVPELDKATRLERPGGHHFDGNYEAIAEAILARLAPRTASAATSIR
jgi:type IV secretory pathway VirJ component